MSPSTLKDWKAAARVLLGLHDAQVDVAVPWNEAFEDLRAAMAQQDAQAVPRGWKLVPVEPTPEMVQAAYTHGGGVEADWQAMLNAAPTPPAQQSGAVQ